MTDDDRALFVEHVECLCSAFGKEADKPLLRAYWLAVEDIEPEAFERGCKRALRELRFMPTPAELREMSGKVRPSDAALIAWPTVMALIANVGPYQTPEVDAPTAAAIGMIGGWVHLCELSHEELERYYRQRFIDSYKTAARTRVAARPLIGLHKQDAERLAESEALAGLLGAPE